VELVGTLEGQHEVTVSSEVAASVTAVQADLGDPVQQGQSIVELDPTEFRLAVDRQRSALLQVLTQLGVSKEGEAVPEASETSIVRRAAADLADAKSNFDRVKALVAKSVEAKSVYDSAEARYQAAQANYTAAQEQVRNLLAQVDNLRVQLALAQKKLADCTIRAPFTGAVKERLVDVGQYVREQTPVMSITTMNPLKLLSSVPERWFPYVHPGAAMELTVEAYNEKFPCKVHRVGRAVDSQSRTFNIEAMVDNSRGKLRPGLFARALLITSKIDSVIRVPAAAVISYYGVQKVYAIENGQVRERVVKLGDRSGNFIEITQGLKVGERIATSELTRMREGIRVKIREES
jgi:RND family efflux transporter MFP subunit